MAPRLTEAVQGGLSTGMRNSLLTVPQLELSTIRLALPLDTNIISYTLAVTERCTGKGGIMPILHSLTDWPN